VESLLIDLRFRRVIRQDETVELSRRVFDLLLVFMSEPHVLHTRSALFERVWPKLLVDDANLSQSIWMLRRALGDENKSWIRTVAKSGYVFEPPGPVSIATLPRQPDGAELSNPGAPAKATDAPVVTAAPHSALRRSRSGHLWTIWKRLAMAASLAFVSAIAGSQADGVRYGTSIAALRVVLIRVNDDSAEADLEWTLRLLDTWLAWKLDSLPETVRMTQEDLTADELSYPPRVVLLMVGRPQGRPDQVFLRASLNGTSVGDGLPAQAGSDAGRQIELRGSIADVPHMVDAISKQTLAQLLPHRASDRWPSLLLSPDEAKKYVEAAEAIHRREWSKALSSAEDVVQSAPNFGPARLLLAQALNRHGETRMATEQMLAARRSISPLPADAEAVLDAQRLITTTGSHFEANAAYAALSARYPERAEFAIGHAKTLIQSSKPDAALEILSRPEWSQKPRRIRIHHAIALAEAEMAYGRTAIAAKHAQRAIDLIGKAQKGWEIDLGTAQLLLATANHSLYDREHSSDEYENAARTFESGGAKLDALHAKFLAEITRQNSSGEARVMEILEEVRSIGDRRLEIEILLNIASSQFSYGDHIDGKRNLQQALTVANMAGDDIAQQIVEVKLVREDIFAGDF
jgi:DNA-binding winged helix-turn-helix (wHTH) protein/thioredoxin-like negative regulator of GroEL